MIGSTRYYELNLSEGTVAVGYTFLARSHWGEPHNQEMKKLMLDYAFQTVNKVVFHIGEHNIRSRKAAEKTGATMIGTMQAQCRNGDWVTVIIYEIQKNYWLGLKDTNSAAAALKD